MSVDIKSPSRLLAAAGLAVMLSMGGAAAQGTGGPPPVSTENPSGQNPTGEAELLQQLQGGTLQGRVSIPDSRAAILEQPRGRDYRAFHETWLPWIGGIAIVGMLVLLVVFYFWRGRILFEQGPDTGRKILRFGAFERFNHWMTASAFIVLGLTGLNYVFGKRLIFPLIGPDAFAAWSQWAKYIHNFVAWPFMIGLVFMFLVWVKDNLPSRVDLRWLREFGGFTSGHHPPARRFNAGQKGIFWSVIIGGAALSVSGVLLLFPFTAAQIGGMQTAQFVHGIAGVILVAIILAHIYIGSIGMEGAYDAMGSGEVDLGWAKTHHSLWVEEEQARTSDGKTTSPRGVPAE